MSRRDHPCDGGGRGSDIKRLSQSMSVVLLKMSVEVVDGSDDEPSEIFSGGYRLPSKYEPVYSSLSMSMGSNWVSVDVAVVVGKVSSIHDTLPSSTELAPGFSSTVAAAFVNAGPVDVDAEATSGTSAMSRFGLEAPAVLGITVRRWRGLKTQSTLARSQRTHGGCFDDEPSWFLVVL